MKKRRLQQLFKFGPIKIWRTTIAILGFFFIQSIGYAQIAVKSSAESIQNVLETDYEGLPLKKVTDKTALAKTKTILDKGRPTLRFEQNEGQFVEEVLYKAKAKQATHFFLKNEMRSMVSDSKGEEQLAYAIEFKNANTEPRISGKGNAKNMGGRQNYIRAGGTYSNVPMFRRLDYNDLWTGIHANFHEKEGDLKYDFVVEPGADPTQVQLQMKGATDLKVNAEGELEFTTAFGTLRKGAPYTFQRINNERVKIESAYQI